MFFPSLLLLKPNSMIRKQRFPVHACNNYGWADLLKLIWVSHLSSQDADAVILAVADEEGAVLVHEDAVRAGHLAGERVAVGAVALFAGASDDFEIAGLRVHAADRVVLHVGDEKVAGAVEANLVRQVKRRLQRRTAIARLALSPTTSFLFLLLGGATRSTFSVSPASPSSRSRRTPSSARRSPPVRECRPGCRAR